MSLYRVSVLEIWRSTEESEKKSTLAEFIKLHGEHYSKEDLLNYLEKKYRARLSPYTLPITTRSQEH